MTDLQADNPFRRIWSKGYRSLLPIAPPDADFHPDSTLWRMAAKGKSPAGKAPAVRGEDGLWRGLDLRRMEAAEPDLDVWQAWGAGCGLRMGDGLVGLDVDCTDLETTRAICRRAFQTLGASAARVGRFPKALLLYRVEPDPPYDEVRFRLTDDGDQHLVQLTTSGKQAVIHGVHPGTLKPYTWTTGEIPALDDLPRVDAAAVGELMDWIEETYGARRYRGGSREEPVRQEDLIADIRLVREAVKRLPNPDHVFPEREHWIAMGAAIKAAAGPEHEDEAFELWECWSARWDGGEHDADIAAAEWRRIKAPYKIGAHYLFDHARRLGGFTGEALLYYTSEAAGAEGEEGAEGGGAEKAALDPAAFFQAQEAAARAQRDDCFELLDLDQIENLPRPKFLIDRHIPEQALGFLYAPPGSYKSFFALSWALSIAYGLDEWQGDPINVQEGAQVLYLAAEGSAGIRQRVRAWKRRHADLIAGRSAAFHLIRQPMDFMALDDVKKLVRTVSAARLDRLTLVVVDTVSRVLPGADENLQKDMTLFVRACDAVREVTGATVLGVHHANQAGKMRGSSVMVGAADFVLAVEKGEAARAAVLHAVKHKDVEDGWEEHYEMAVEGDGEEASLTPVRRSGPPRAEIEAGADAPVTKRILAAMAAAWNEGRPWAHAKAPVDPERKAVRCIVRDHGLPAHQAERLLAMWTSAGAIEVAREQRGGARLRGYKVQSLTPRLAIFD